MGLFDDLRKHAESVRKYQAVIRGEEATKNSLIMPFLRVLGYDVFDPSEVQPEFTSEMGRREKGPAEKVDYAVCKSGVPIMFLECKAVDVEPKQHSGQLARYFNATASVKIAVVTNGIRYLFFTDLEEPNIMSNTPFFEFNMLDFSERDAETLEDFTKDRFKSDNVRAKAEDVIYTSKVTAGINVLLRNPSESFVRFLVDELDIATGGKLTKNRLEKFIPIVKKAIQTTLLDMATRSIKSETEVAPPPPAPPAVTPNPPVATPPQVPHAETPTKVAVTSQDKINAFEAIKKMCGDSPFALKHVVAYKDTVSYLSIHIASPKGWFLRVFLDAKKKSVASKITLERAQPLAPGMEVEVAPEAFGKSRVYINGVSDLLRLRPLILLAFEEEAKRIEAGDSDDE